MPEGPDGAIPVPSVLRTRVTGSARVRVCLCVKPCRECVCANAKIVRFVPRASTLPRVFQRVKTHEYACTGYTPAQNEANDDYGFYL